MADVRTSIKNERRVAKRREQIILAATQLFVRKGFHRTTLRDLAEETGISHGSIYDYVGKKEDILLLIHQYFTARAGVRSNSRLEEAGTPLEKLRRLILAEITESFVARQARLLFYREVKGMPREQLGELLAVERDRLLRIEAVIEECIQAGVCRDINPRLLSNLIVMMADTWTLKNWDLTGHTTKHQIETMVLDAIFDGLLQVNKSEDKGQPGIINLSDRSILLISSGRFLREAFCQYFADAGIRLVSYQKDPADPAPETIEALSKKQPGNFRLYLQSENGPLGPDLLNGIMGDFGPLDSVIINWDTILDADDMDIDFNLFCHLVPVLKEKLGKGSTGRIIHIAPSYWAREADRLLYESSRARIISLTQQMSRDLGPSGIRVNCIAPGFVEGLRPLEQIKDPTQSIAERIPLRSVGKMEELLASIRFLLSDESNYLTGQILGIDGGMA